AAVIQIRDTLPAEPQVLGGSGEDALDRSLDGPCGPRRTLDIQARETWRRMARPDPTARIDIEARDGLRERVALPVLFGDGEDRIAHRHRGESFRTGRRGFGADREPESPTLPCKSMDVGPALVSQFGKLPRDCVMSKQTARAGPQPDHPERLAQQRVDAREHELVRRAELTHAAPHVIEAIAGALQIGEHQGLAGSSEPDAPRAVESNRVRRKGVRETVEIPGVV